MTAAILNKSYTDEKNRLMKLPEIRAMAIDLVHNNVKIDSTDFNFMNSARLTAQKLGVIGNTIGAVAEAVTAVVNDLQNNDTTLTSRDIVRIQGLAFTLSATNDADSHYLWDIRNIANILPIFEDLLLESTNDYAQYAELVKQYAVAKGMTV